MLYKVNRPKLFLQREVSWTNSLVSCLQRDGRAKPEAGSSSCSGSRSTLQLKGKAVVSSEEWTKCLFEKLTRNKVANVQKEALEV